MPHHPPRSPALPWGFTLNDPSAALRDPGGGGTVISIPTLQNSTLGLGEATSQQARNPRPSGPRVRFLTTVSVVSVGDKNKRGRKASVTSPEHLLCTQPGGEGKPRRRCRLPPGCLPADTAVKWAHFKDEENRVPEGGSGFLRVPGSGRPRADTKFTISFPRRDGGGHSRGTGWCNEVSLHLEKTQWARP